MFLAGSFSDSFWFKSRDSVLGRLSFFLFFFSQVLCLYHLWISSFSVISLPLARNFLPSRLVYRILISLTHNFPLIFLVPWNIPSLVGKTRIPTHQRRYATLARRLQTTEVPTRDIFFFSLSLNISEGGSSPRQEDDSASRISQESTYFSHIAPLLAGVLSTSAFLTLVFLATFMFQSLGSGRERRANDPT